MTEESMKPDKAFGDALEEVLKTLTYREREIIKLRTGLGDGYAYTTDEIARIFGVKPRRVLQVEAQGIRKLPQPIRAKFLEGLLSPQALEQFEALEATRDSLEVRDRLQQVAHVSVDLIRYVRSRTEDISRLPWQVFEQLVAECLASRGFESVRLVGHDATTAADIFAIEHLGSSGVRLRYFIEVKRWKDKVGVEVIDRVLGAMTSERSVWGWHLAMIVSPVGFKSFRKYTREGLKLMGVELRDRDDIVTWLKEYRPSDKGLWLPQGFAVGITDTSSARRRAGIPPNS